VSQLNQLANIFGSTANAIHVGTSVVVLAVTNMSKAIHVMVINILSFLYQRNSGNGVEHEIMYFFFKLDKHFNLCFM
jgi:hypothetical protein